MPTVPPRSRRPSLSRPRARQLAAVVLAGAAVLSLAACDTYTSNCSTELGAVECTLEISGSTRHDLPYPINAADGSEKPPSQKEDSILLVEASEGGTATVDVNDESECSPGEEFTVGSTTFTCTEIGDDSIVLDLVRG